MLSCISGHGEKRVNWIFLVPSTRHGFGATRKRRQAGARNWKTGGGEQIFRYIHKYANSPHEMSLICILRTDKIARAIRNTLKSFSAPRNYSSARRFVSRHSDLVARLVSPADKISIDRSGRDFLRPVRESSPGTLIAALLCRKSRGH